MEINTFWKIVLKSIGLWLILQGIYFIPQIYTLAILPLTYSQTEPIPRWIFALILLVILIYIVIVRIFLFSSSWLIKVLKLDRHFTSDRINLNVPESKILSIIVIIIGAVVFVDSFPFLISRIFQFFQQEALIKDYENTGWILFSAIKTLAAYFMMTNSKTIVHFIERQSSNNDQ